MAEIPKLFGIDFGSKFIKTCQLSNEGHKHNIEALGMIEMEEGMLDNITTDGVEFVTTKLQSLLKTSKISTKNCVINIPEKDVFQRFLNLPLMEDEKVSEAVFWAMKPVIPVPLEEVNISFLPIGEVMQGNNKFVKWYVVAAPKNKVIQYESIIQKSGLYLLAIDTEALASTRAVIANHDMQGDNIVLDFGNKTTVIVLVRNRRVAFTQTMESGAGNLTKAVAADFGITETQAFEYIRTYGLNQEAAAGKIFQSINPTIENLLAEISRTMVYFKEKLGGTHISRIYLTGGGGNLKGLPQTITAKLGVETQLVNLFNNISIGSDFKARFVDSNVTSFNVAIGLALKGVIRDA